MFYLSANSTITTAGKLLIYPEQLAVAKTVLRLSFRHLGDGEWVDKTIPPYAVARYGGMILSTYEIREAIIDLIKKKIIIKHPIKDQYRINRKFIKTYDDKRKLLLAPSCDLQERYNEIIKTRMVRYGLPEPSQMHFELYCILQCIFKTINFYDIADDYSKIPINSSTVKNQTKLWFSENEISFFLSQLISQGMIIQHPYDKCRYKIAKQICQYEGITTLMVIPSESFNSRWGFIVRDRMRRAQLQESDKVPLKVSAFSFGIIRTLIETDDALRVITPSHVWKYSNISAMQSAIDKVVDELCFVGVVERDKQGFMQISFDFLLFAEGIVTALVFPAN